MPGGIVSGVSGGIDGTIPVDPSNDPSIPRFPVPDPEITTPGVPEVTLPSPLNFHLTGVYFTAGGRMPVLAHIDLNEGEGEVSTFSNVTNTAFDVSMSYTTDPIDDDYTIIITFSDGKTADIDIIVNP